MCYLFVALVVVTLQVVSSLAGAYPGDGGVLYSGSERLNYDMPTNCLGQNYCFEKRHDYPEKRIEKLLEKIPFVHRNQEAPTQSMFGFRGGNDENQNKDCPYNTTTKPIYYIVDQNDEVRVVIQSPKLQQIYEVRQCENPGRFLDSASFVRGGIIERKYYIERVTTHMDLEFFVLDTINNAIGVAMAKGGIPVCCRCRYTTI